MRRHVIDSFVAQDRYVRRPRGHPAAEEEEDDHSHHTNASSGQSAWLSHGAHKKINKPQQRQNNDGPLALHQVPALWDSEVQTTTLPKTAQGINNVSARHGR